jgi:hypothetical protein
VETKETEAPRKRGNRFEERDRRTAQTFQSAKICRKHEVENMEIQNEQ